MTGYRSVTYVTNTRVKEKHNKCVALYFTTVLRVANKSIAHDFNSYRCFFVSTPTTF